MRWIVVRTTLNAVKAAKSKIRPLKIAYLTSIRQQKNCKFYCDEFFKNFLPLKLIFWPQKTTSYKKPLLKKNKKSCKILTPVFSIKFDFNSKKYHKSGRQVIQWKNKFRRSKIQTRVRQFLFFKELRWMRWKFTTFTAFIC